MGHPQSDETRRKISATLVKHWAEPIKRKKRCDSLTKHWADPIASKVHRESIKAFGTTYHHSVETRAIISVKAKAARTPEYRAAVSQRMKKYYSVPENLLKASEAKKVFYSDPKNIEAMCAIAQKASKKISQASIEHWKNPEYRQKVMHRRQMSGPELVFMEICKQYGFKYKFVGNGALWIGNKNPDFVGTMADHRLIEIWGDYFHKGQDPQERVDHFKQFGYDCIVIWASELRHQDMVIDRVRRFA